jgi:hypothetical protein
MFTASKAQIGVPISLILCGWLIADGADPVGASEPVSFRNDVMAVLSKSGCNAGTCHGNQNGKNGFKLSLRGQDPGWDFDALTRDSQGRRTNTQEPAQSLILLKATGSMAHEGGRRFAVGSPEYGILLRWIAGGLANDPAAARRLVRIEAIPNEAVLVAPQDHLEVQVRAWFSDGSSRNVTNLAVFETSNLGAAIGAGGMVRGQQFGETAILVRYLDQQTVVRVAFVPARPDFVWQSAPEVNYIDRHVFTKLHTLKMNPSELCSDSVFVRRVYLDSLGLLPTAKEAKGFLQDTRADKRARLIDQVLGRAEFGDNWALKWSDLLRNEEKVLDRKGVQGLHQWLRQNIADDRPLNELARELISARGSTYGNPAANFYRALRDPQIRAETVGQVFLGVRLQCAKCHNHPFDRWTQNDYHSLAAFFAQIQYQIVENNRRDKFDKHEFDGEQIVWLSRDGEWKDPKSGLTLQPRWLGASTRDIDPGADRLQVLADWVARPDNPFFARAQVNRIWYHLMGRGIVEPIDDFRVTNPPSNEALLNALAEDFAAHQFRLRPMVRTIMNSRTYQLSATPNDSNRDDAMNYAHAIVRPLAAEPLLDALMQVTGATVAFNGYPQGLRAGQLPGVHAARQRDRRLADSEQFLKVFGKPERLLACECERSEDTTLNRALQLMSGPLLNDLLTRPDNRLAILLASKKQNSAVIEEMYLSALSRLPTEAERQAAVTALEMSADRRAALEDLMWSLVNAKEFLLRH